MAAGDVDAQIVDCTTAAIDTAVTAMYVTANDHFMMASTQNGMKMLIVHIEEA